MFDYLLTQICFSFALNSKYVTYHPTCGPTLTAAAIQYKIKPTIDETQSLLENKVRNTTGEQIWFVAGTYYSFSQTGMLKFSTNIKPIADSLSYEGTTKFNQGTLNLTWNY